MPKKSKAKPAKKRQPPVRRPRHRARPVAPPVIPGTSGPIETVEPSSDRVPK